MNIDTILKTPSKKTLLQLGKIFFYIIIFGGIVIYFFPLITKVICQHQNRRDEQLIEKVTEKQDSLQKLHARLIDEKLDCISAKIENTNAVISTHILRTEKDNKAIQESLEKLYFNVSFEKKNTTISQTQYTDNLK